MASLLIKCETKHDMHVCKPSKMNMTTTKFAQLQQLMHPHHHYKLQLRHIFLFDVLEPTKIIATLENKKS